MFCQCTCIALLKQLFTALTEVIRDNARDSKLKQGILPALGELLFLVATQEEQKGCSVESWTVPAITYTMIARCIREGVGILACPAPLGLLASVQFDFKFFGLFGLVSLV